MNGFSVSDSDTERDARCARGPLSIRSAASPACVSVAAPGAQQWRQAGKSKASAPGGVEAVGRVRDLGRKADVAEDAGDDHRVLDRPRCRKKSGAEGSRTLDLLNAIQALSQLSYGPTDR
jgi:hypothetical protein